MIRAGYAMRHVTIQLLREDLPRASLALARLEAFAPDDRPLLAAELPEVPGKAFRERMRRAHGYLDRLQQLLEIHPERGSDFHSLDLPRDELEAISEWLEAAWAECSPYEVAQHDLQEQLRELEQLEHSLTELGHLDIDLGAIRSEHPFLDVVVGVLPSANLKSLRDALSLSEHLVLNAVQDQDLARIVIAGLHTPGQPLDKVLSAASFQRLDIPETFRAEPAKVREQLATQRRDLLDQSHALHNQREHWREQHDSLLKLAQDLLDAAEPYVSMQGAARTQGPLAVLQGWLPENQIEAAEQRLTEHLEHPFLLEQRRPRNDELHLVPIPPAREGWLHPFSNLVRQYGVPRFGEFDPTWLFALTYCAMFGMMFGDVGHGAMFVLFGLLMRRRLAGFTPIFVAAGGMAMVFGFLYGSIFGVEHWLHPLWIAPMSDPIYMLTVALGWGVAFLTLGALIAIANRLLAGDHAGALFDPGGIFSLTLYIALLVGVIEVMQGDGFGTAPTAIVLLSLALLMARQWMESTAPYGERALTVIIETWEIISGYASSSLSFLRVAAFSLNHVALSLAVFTLADMMSSTAGHWAMLIFGNLFVMVLEGIIVAIQVLRLEYYEGFSRYFYGDGRPFTPLRLGARLSKSETS